MARSVLQVADQRAGIYPERCVLSGVETPRAVRLTATQWGGPQWMLGLPGLAFVAGHLPGRARCPVALPVSERVWKLWRFRELAAMTMLAAGATFFGIGVANATIGLAAFGLVIAIAAVAYRTRAHHNFWVTCTLRPAASTIIVEPTHRLFDEEARKLFTRTVR